MPAATAWHWEFGDGAQSDERNPVHVYAFAGNFDVRLTVTGAGGPAVRQKAAYVDGPTRCEDGRPHRPRPEIPRRARPQALISPPLELGG